MAAMLAHNVLAGVWDIHEASLIYIYIYIYTCVDDKDRVQYCFSFFVLFYFFFSFFGGRAKESCIVQKESACTGMAQRYWESGIYILTTFAYLAALWECFCFLLEKEKIWVREKVGSSNSMCRAAGLPSYP